MERFKRRLNTEVRPRKFLAWLTGRPPDSGKALGLTSGPRRATWRMPATDWR
jgi:hypothetical protein